jgi:hypothetical protein
MCKRVVEYIVRVVLVIAEILHLYCSDEPPVYEPDRWNDGSTIQYCNNCYNYACNIQTNTFAQPGYANGIDPNINCDEVSDAAIADGLRLIDPNEDCGACGHKVALVIDPNWPDYHWYRKDKYGMWSHKGGSGEAKDRDYLGNIITDPRTADRRGNGGLNYSIFCGFFCSYKGDVEIAGWSC